MNISTYEARIAALEAQIGPGPGPVPETGLVSVVITPDITLSDETSLNAKLAAMMPIGGGEEKTVSESASLVNGAEYTITYTPGVNWYAFGNDVSQQKGEPFVEQVVISGTLFSTGGGAAETQDVDELDPEKVAFIHITVGAL